MIIQMVAKAAGFTRNKTDYAVDEAVDSVSFENALREKSAEADAAQNTNNIRHQSSETEEHINRDDADSPFENDAEEAGEGNSRIESVVFDVADDRNVNADEREERIHAASLADDVPEAQGQILPEGMILPHQPVIDGLEDNVADTEGAAVENAEQAETEAGESVNGSVDERITTRGMTVIQREVANQETVLQESSIQVESSVPVDGFLNSSDLETDSSVNNEEKSSGSGDLSVINQGSVEYGNYPDISGQFELNSEANHETLKNADLPEGTIGDVFSRENTMPVDAGVSEKDFDKDVNLPEEGDANGILRAEMAPSNPEIIELPEMPLSAEVNDFDQSVENAAVVANELLISAKSSDGGNIQSQPLGTPVANSVDGGSFGIGLSGDGAAANEGEDAESGHDSLRGGINSLLAGVVDKGAAPRHSVSGREVFDQVLETAQVNHSSVDTGNVSDVKTPGIPQPLRSNMEMQTLFQNFDQMVSRTLRSDSGIMRIELEPANLGRIVLRCRQDDTGGISVELVAGRNDVRMLLQSNEATLRGQLEATGISLGELVVSARDQGRESFRERFFEKQTGKPAIGARRVVAGAGAGTGTVKTPDRRSGYSDGQYLWVA